MAHADPTTDAIARNELLAHYAIRAPSTLNTQPWLFRATAEYLEIHADPRRQLRVMDPAGREMLISCGAALANAEVAGRQLGYHMEIETNGTRAHPARWLARVRPGEPRTPRDLDTQLFRAMDTRHTVRRPYLKRGVPISVVRKIIDLAETEGVVFSMADEVETRTALAAAAFEQMSRLAQDPERSREASRWRASWQRERTDGVPQAALGMAAHEYLWIYLCGGAKAVSSRARITLRQRLLQGPRLLVVATPHDTAPDWLKTGYAMERALLRAASLNIQACFFGALVSTPEAREETRLLLGLRHTPQLVLGLGHTTSQPITPRRPIADVLVP